jgi:hypothetical protein
MLRKVIVLLLIICLSLLIGCSIDKAGVIEHPERAKPGDTISVLLSDIYMYVSNSSRIDEQVVRDSIHVLAGLPKEWSVTGLDFYTFKDFKYSKIINSNSSSIDSILRDSVSSFESKKSPMSRDYGLSDSFKGRELDAHNIKDDSTVTITADNVDQWIGFSAPLGIVFQKGSSTDVAVPMDSAINIYKNSGLSDGTFDPSSIGMIPYDTIGINVIPILVFARIKVGVQDKGKHTLYYYTKTGKIPSMQPQIGGNDKDIGDMVFVNVDISTASVNNRLVAVKPFCIKARPDRIQINLGDISRSVNADIFSIDGQLVKRLNPVSSGAFFWGGVNETGCKVSPGAYYIRIVDGKEQFIQKIEMTH